ncbi:putative nitrilase [Patellaria atrata CBS 101060]|uniref:Nitrilase n=1 Tax=Patellaria atrata CBS 101060 TaxID=1346257 RepID=A0A9P4SHA6_9PEZI|nr:putative nitrilase [Patellaria atrata CBS 101060]
MVLAAVGQICSTASMSHNLQQCRLLVQKAVSMGVKALFLPEASDYIASSGPETISLAKDVKESEFVLGLQEEAQKANLCINVGVHEPAQGGQKVKNTLLWIDEKGEIAQRYQKLHLFDVEIEGGPVLKESNSVEPGPSILPPFPTVFGNVGLMICFDLRFPTISTALRTHPHHPAHLLTYPSAFTLPTGHAHWTPLLRARAIETQTYVIAAAQVGRHNEKRVSYGKSMIIDPWGRVVAELDGVDVDGGKELREGEGLRGPEIAVAEIDLGVVERVRREVPLRARGDVYGEVWG